MYPTKIMNWVPEESEESEESEEPFRQATTYHKNPTLAPALDRRAGTKRATKGSRKRRSSPFTVCSAGGRQQRTVTSVASVVHQQATREGNGQTKRAEGERGGGGGGGGGGGEEEEEEREKKRKKKRQTRKKRRKDTYLRDIAMTDLRINEKLSKTIADFDTAIKDFKQHLQLRKECALGTIAVDRGSGQRASSKWNYLVIPEGRALHTNYPEEAPQDFVNRTEQTVRYPNGTTTTEEKKTTREYRKEKKKRENCTTCTPVRFVSLKGLEKIDFTAKFISGRNRSEKKAPILGRTVKQSRQLGIVPIPRMATTVFDSISYDYENLRLARRQANYKAYLHVMQRAADAGVMIATPWRSVLVGDWSMEGAAAVIPIEKRLIALLAGRSELALNEIRKKEKRRKKVIPSFRLDRASRQKAHAVQRQATLVYRVPTMASYKGRCRVPYLDPPQKQKGIEFQAFPPIHGYNPMADCRLVVEERRTLSNYVFLYVSLAERTYVPPRRTSRVPLRLVVGPSNLAGSYNNKRYNSWVKLRRSSGQVGRKRKHERKDQGSSQIERERERNEKETTDTTEPPLGAALKRASESKRYHRHADTQIVKLFEIINLEDPLFNDNGLSVSFAPKVVNEERPQYDINDILESHPLFSTSTIRNEKRFDLEEYPLCPNKEERVV
ncbi:hypothetical protein WN51_03682 [Melipona quadrifasciata]|uniref:Uncharacterized protein n=1 Tax=Melipona quadrifasciata TaxID=166423 RepID=A0A0N0U3Z4_9HYME|nr:hypothetical protein WN51_03682 [Melipona quadrifasciata]